MPPHPLTNFEIQKYYQNEPRINGVYSRDNLLEIKYGTYEINLDEYSDIGNHWVALYVLNNDVVHLDLFWGKENYVGHIRALNLALNHRLTLRKVHRIIQYNQKAWFKPYTNMYTKIRTEGKNEFRKNFFKLMNNAAFGKTMGNIRKHRGIKLVTTDKRRNQSASEPN